MSNSRLRSLNLFKAKRTLVSCLSLLLIFTTVSSAKEWHGIVPLHSTRTDVIRMLGRPTISSDDLPKGFTGFVDFRLVGKELTSTVDHFYSADEGYVTITYTPQPCELGCQDFWRLKYGHWNVPHNMVESITVDLIKAIPFASLKTPDLERERRGWDEGYPPHITYYHDKKEGIELAVQDGRVISITYEPTEQDREQLCKKKVDQYVPQFRY